VSDVAIDFVYPLKARRFTSAGFCFLPIHACAAPPVFGDWAVAIDRPQDSYFESICSDLARRAQFRLGIRTGVRRKKRRNSKQLQRYCDAITASPR
jgi:hypothetical protein